MGYANDQDKQDAVLNLADEAIIPHPPAPQNVLVAAQGFAETAGITAENARSM